MLPQTLTDIDYDAFNGCTKLSSVYYNGTKAKANAIDISSIGNSDLLYAQWHYNCSKLEYNGEDYYYCGDCKCYYTISGKQADIPVTPPATEPSEPTQPTEPTQPAAPAGDSSASADFTVLIVTVVVAILFAGGGVAIGFIIGKKKS